MAKAARSTQNQGGGEQTEAVVEAPAPSNLSLLAREEFGDQYHGEVTPDPKPAPTPAPVQEPPSDEPATPAEPEDDDYQPDDNAQVEGDDKTPTAPDEAAEDTTEPIATVRELIDHLEADPAWFDGLKVDVKVNDQTSQVALKDLVANYQMGQAADERLEQAKTRAAQAQEEQAQRSAMLEQQYAIAGQLVSNLEQQLTADVAAINWDELHRTDPAMWSAERVRLGERQTQIQQTKAHIRDQYQYAMQQREQETQTHRQANFAEQTQLLMENMPKVSPEWADPQKLPQRKAELADYLIKQGFSKDDVLGASDHRLLVQAEKARLWDLSQSKVQLTKKRISTVPRVMKPGARKEPSAVNLEKVKEAQKRLRSTGHMDDALALLRMKQTNRR